MLPNTNFFTGVYKRLLPMPQWARSYIQTQHGERKNVGGLAATILLMNKI